MLKGIPHVLKHLLLPTDGSEVSQATLLRGVQLAKEFKARITGICVAPQKAKDAT